MRRNKPSAAGEMRTYRAIGRALALAAASTETMHTCGHSCEHRAGECPCSAGECKGEEGEKQLAIWWLKNTPAGQAIAAAATNQKINDGPGERNGD